MLPIVNLSANLSWHVGTFLTSILEIDCPHKTPLRQAALLVDEVASLLAAIMNASKQSRCLFCRFFPSTAPPSSRPRNRKFNTSPPKQANRKPAYPNVKAADLGLAKKRVDDAAQKFTPYTPREKQLLALKYTPDQMRAIEAGEASINPRDIVRQGRLRTDKMRIQYIDDFSQIKPIVDKPVRAPDDDIDPDIRMLSDEETETKFAKWTQSVAQQASEDEARAEEWENTMDEQDVIKLLEDKGVETGIGPDDGLTPQQRGDRLRKFLEYGEGIDETASWERFVSNANNFFTSPKGTLDFQSDSLAPILPKLSNPGMKRDSEEEDPRRARLLRTTGMTEQELKKIRIKNLVFHRVQNQTRMGKIESFYALSIAGNENGLLGLGEGKSSEMGDAKRQSQWDAVQNMKPIPRYENRTIFGEVDGKVGAAMVKLSARGPGQFIHRLPSSFTYCIPRSTVLLIKPSLFPIDTDYVVRFRKQMPTSHLRNGASGRYHRSSSAVRQESQQDECRQSDISSNDGPAAAGRCGEGEGTEDD